jgi:hypothetical protein
MKLEHGTPMPPLPYGERIEVRGLDLLAYSRPSNPLTLSLSPQGRGNEEGA